MQDGKQYEAIVDITSGFAKVDETDPETRRVLEAGGHAYIPKASYENSRRFIAAQPPLPPGKQHYQIDPYLHICGCGMCDPTVPTKCRDSELFQVMKTRGFGRPGKLTPELRERFDQGVYISVPDVSPIFTLTARTVILQATDGLTDVANDSHPACMNRLSVDPDGLSFKRVVEIVCDSSLSPEVRATRLAEDIKDRYVRKWLVSEDIRQMDDVAAIISVTTSPRHHATS